MVARLRGNGSQRGDGGVRNDACSPRPTCSTLFAQFTRIFHAKWKMKENERGIEKEREREKLPLDYLGNRVSRANRGPLRGWREKEEQRRKRMKREREREASKKGGLVDAKKRKRKAEKEMKEAVRWI